MNANVTLLHRAWWVLHHLASPALANSFPTVLVSPIAELGFPLPSLPPSLCFPPGMLSPLLPPSGLAPTSSRPPFLTSRLGISFAYYGVILASTELLERDLVCGSRSESEVVETVGPSEESQSPCHCHMFAPSDYRTMIISTVGEIARECLSPFGAPHCFGWGHATQSLRGQKGDLVIDLAPAW